MPNPLYGEILLCEDNDLNQMVIKAQLTKLGFLIHIANDGAEAVAAVSYRMLTDGKPFDLILMDIHMPVKDGLEAADDLHKIGCKTPIVALTASVTPEETETYRAHHMPDCLSKPIDEAALIACLSRYFKIQIQATNPSDDEEEKKLRLLTGFVKRNQTTYADIETALASGDTKLAHRLAHTLRGLAGLMGKNELQEAARTIEYAILNNQTETIHAHMPILKHELRTVLDELSPLLDKQKQTAPDPAGIDPEQALAIFKKLKPLLEADNAACLDYTRTLKPFSNNVTPVGRLFEQLIDQIEEIEFENALKLLEKITAEIKAK